MCFALDYSVENFHCLIGLELGLDLSLVYNYIVVPWWFKTFNCQRVDWQRVGLSANCLVSSKGSVNPIPIVMCWSGFFHINVEVSQPRIVYGVYKRR